jgi:hypothetical protein
VIITRSAMPCFLQRAQQASGRFGISPRLGDFAKHGSVLVDGPLQPMPGAGNADNDLIEVPLVA